MLMDNSGQLLIATTLICILTNYKPSEETFSPPYSRLHIEAYVAVVFKRSSIDSVLIDIVSYLRYNSCGNESTKNEAPNLEADSQL